MTRLPKRYFKSISDYVRTYYTAYGAQRAQKLYDAVKTVTEDFTRTDPVYVRIGEDGEPEIHCTMTQADGSSYFAGMDLGDATLVMHSVSAITSISSMFAYFSAKRIIGDVSIRLTSWNNPPFNGVSKFIDMSELTIDLTGSSTINYMFGNLQNNVNLPQLKNIAASADNMFAFSWALTTIPNYDLTSVTSLNNAFADAKAITAFHATGMKVSFDLSPTALQHDAILEVFNNLGEVDATAGITLTLGSDKLALMSDDEKAIATGKGWVLA